MELKLGTTDLVLASRFINGETEVFGEKGPRSRPQPITDQKLGARLCRLNQALRLPGSALRRDLCAPAWGSLGTGHLIRSPLRCRRAWGGRGPGLARGCWRLHSPREASTTTATKSRARKRYRIRTDVCKDRFFWQRLQRGPTWPVGGQKEDSV